MSNFISHEQRDFATKGAYSIENIYAKLNTCIKGINSMHMDITFAIRTSEDLDNGFKLISIGINAIPK